MQVKTILLSPYPVRITNIKKTDDKEYWHVLILLNQNFMLFILKSPLLLPIFNLREREEIVEHF